MSIFILYKNLIQIHDGENSRVYRARRIEDEQPAILKILKAEYPTPDQLRRYRQEYHLTRQLQLPKVIKAYGLEEWHRTLVIILEDFGGVALKEWLKQYPQGLPIDLFLLLAFKIADALGQLHSQAVIHKDINPANIVVNPETMAIKLIDLGISTQLSREIPSLQPPSFLEGTLPYISPEQTGRMNRVLDYRTDFYSLGVTFYELLTGRLPFISNDPMELVHCQIAKQPVSLLEIKPGQIPPFLAEIVGKLMAKNAEDRYQSAWGLKADLEECAVQWEKTGTIAVFPIGRNDISDRFHIHQKLYGREREIAALLAAFERVASLKENRVAAAKSEPEIKDAAAEIVLVTGYSGIGKSALVRSLYKPITAKRGYFISGKFDQFQRHIPYSALADALTSLVKQLLGEPEIILQQWREQLLEALGTNGQIIIEVIPDLELIIGSQSPVPELGAIEAQNRFNLVFQRFMQVFCHPEHPLVMFLDDVQWADLATLNLLERLLGDSQINNFLLIVTYRDNEVSIGHPLALAVAQLQRKGANIEQITLTPLPLDQIARLIADTLHCETRSIYKLAELVQRKTQGNPFFINEFLKTLYKEGLLVFNHVLKCWQWDLAQIEGIGFTDNVVELTLGQLQKLPASVQQVLSTAAFLGTNFDLKTLSSIENRTPTAIFTDLKLAIEQGFVVARSLLDENLLIQNYQFVHDRIQQAAYALIPESEQAKTHYQIGQLLLSRIPPEAREDHIFELVNQLNYGTALISDRIERDELAQLNFLACRKARTGIAYQAVLEYAAIGLNLLGNEAWQRQYAITLRLHELVAEAAAITGDFDVMYRSINAAIEQGKTVLEQLQVYLIKIQALTTQNKFSEAIACGQLIMGKLGINFPDCVTPVELQKETEEIKALIGDRSIEELLHLPAMVDPEKLAIMKIAGRMIPACYFTASPLFPLLASLQVKLSLQYGNSPISSTGYGDYGIFILNFQKDIATSNQFGQLAYSVASTAKDKSIQAVTFVPVGLHLYHHQHHLRDTLPILRAGYQAALEVGKLEYIGHNVHGFCVNSFWCGQILTELEPQIRAYRQMMLKLDLVPISKYCLIILETILLLSNSAENQVFNIENDNDTWNSDFLNSDDATRILYFYLHRASLRFIFGHIALAQTDAIQARQYIVGGTATICEAGFYFYDSLIALATVSESPKKLEIQLQQVEENQANLQLWATYAPMNYLHKWQLVEAEKYRVLGKKLEAIEMYDRAIAGAKANGYIQEEALVNELATKFYLSWGREKVAQVYLQEAHYCYLRWGATAKIQHLETQYPQFFVSERSPHLPTSRTSISTTGSTNNSAVLDLSTVMKSSQAIASEIVLENLLQTLMKIMLENAGAQMGCLLLPTSTTSSTLKNFSIAIYSNTSTANLSLTQAIDLILPESVLHYVARTHESVILDNPVKSGNFSRDLYIQSIKPLSILCYPLLNQGELVAIVYLENQVTTGAFTKDRVEFLQLLSGQAAIAITNAQLYTKVKHSEQQLKQFLEAVPVGIGILDANGLPYYANQRAKELLGQEIVPDATVEEIGQVYHIYIAETQEPYPNEKLPIVRALKGEASSADDVEIHQDDRIIPLESWGTPIYNEVGELQYAIVVFQDITQRKQAEKILSNYNRTLEQQVAERTAELQRANQQLARLATLDGLTKIANRRRFDDYLAIEWQRHLREQQSLALILIDIDYFKRYNDHYGHQGGDECLIRVAQTLTEVPQRSSDLVARYGGEEFAAILPNTDLNGGLMIAESMRQAIASLAIPHAQSDVNEYITLSLGVAVLIPTIDQNPEDLIAKADEALYNAKHQGRDRAIAFT
ncbi:diguanylate cyclase [Phormidium sp. LEGE 05292]|uniref:diguanylate cyclase domain-containing protein n=1 Tax=[Phormidium] sp. LEGE 05292 TaxID=767427 RepID=UPI0018822BA9|nr:diguanylate cyclase [Phormidium sp. LEGE 05292]MBE9228078.1 diguanylate cyclase [Phormidium sp. LEGE 05292]